MFFYISDHRHWKDLMERTGTSFEMNPATFTLENMFAMELHKHVTVIGDIVTSAVKELSIEKVIICLGESLITGVRDQLLSVKIMRTYSPSVVCVFPGSEGGGGDLGKHEVQCSALLQRD